MYVLAALGDAELALSAAQVLKRASLGEIVDGADSPFSITDEGKDAVLRICTADFMDAVDDHVAPLRQGNSGPLHQQCRPSMICPVLWSRFSAV